MKRERSDDAARISPDPLPAVPCDLSPYSDDSSAAGPEKYGFSYILALARTAHPDIADADLQDIAQEAFIAFIPRLERRELAHPDAYLAQIIRNKCNDHYRQQKRRTYLPTVSLSAEDGPDRQVAEEARDGLADPANMLEESLFLGDFYNDLAAAITELPPCQQRAAICTLIDKADNPVPLIRAFKARNIGEAQMHWPADQREKRDLQASLSAARHKLANFLHIDLSQYKQRKRRSGPPGSQSNQL
ncbi:MAG: sigma factor [Ktedonobacteraceae bacterium]